MALGTVRPVKDAKPSSELVTNLCPGQRSSRTGLARAPGQMPGARLHVPMPRHFDFVNDAAFFFSFAVEGEFE